MNKKNKGLISLLLVLLITSCNSTNNSNNNSITNATSSNSTNIVNSDSTNNNTANSNSTNDVSSDSSNNSSFTQITNAKAKVVILAGQSNAAGYTYIKEMSRCFDKEKIEEYKYGYDSVLMNYYCGYGSNVSDGEYVPVMLGQGGTTEYFGPEVGMAEKINEAYPTELVYIIKYAIGGTNLYNQWNSPSSGATPGECYRGFIPFVHEALEKLEEEEGVNPEIEAFCWMQGCSDADPQKSPYYYDRLKDFVNDVREEFKDYASEDGIGFIDGGIHDAHVMTMHSVVNDAKKRFAEESDINEFIDTQGLELSYNKEPVGNIDYWHYDSDGMIKLGHAFGEVLVDKFL